MLVGDEWWRPIPTAATADARRILAIRGLRAFADGFVSLLMPAYLLARGFDALAIGTILTSTLIGSSCLTMLVGMIAHRFHRRRMLLAACLLMALTGLGFAFLGAYWPLMVVAFVGTMNPSSGDVSLFLPLEHTSLAQTVDPRRRTALFARYSLVGSLVGAIGTLAASLPDVAERWTGIDPTVAIQAMFLLYGAIGAAAFVLYLRLSPAVEAVAEAPPAPLKESRGIVYRMMALFALDAFGGGFLAQSILALWFFQAYGLSVTTTASILFWCSICASVSQLVAVPVSERFGLINTMVFTHLPANLSLVLLPFAPNLPTAIALLLIRGALSQMDVPTRTSYVMAVVTPEERPAAASLTAIPRSFAQAVAPSLAGYLLTVSSFGWPILIGGGVKAIYDVLLLIVFRKVKPPEETAGPS
jgi:MFS family permease